ncbi:PQQ-dependent sugar dehydrogenase [Parapedobacter lycopersici]|uniref:PQQ-dependent sugar dehydrogenase n=1 Tax=Parapedobacter lycopersici TaxID=1864939 RepID=UPI003340DA3B
MKNQTEKTNIVNGRSNWCLALLSGLVLASCNPAGDSKLATDADNGGLTLPEGFGALVVADSLGAARHLAVNANGDIFVKRRNIEDGRGIVMLSDTDGDGRADKQTGFGDYNGTGIFLDSNYLYASSNTDIFRYALDENGHVIDPNAPDTVVTGLIDRRAHNSKPFTIDGAGNLYVNIGAYSNACQVQDRTKGSPAMQPCPILDSAGGIWQFRADGIRQTYGDGERYATGLRNVMGIDWNNQANTLFVTQHGRDNLHDLFPELYDTKASATLPAEALFRLDKGANAGWPYTYYDQEQKKIVVAPEYGGDGKKESTEDYLAPAVAFPGHMGPNDLLFYTGNMFPEKYKNGAFVAFHGSWNRAPEEQAGYMVAFIPFKDGAPSGEWEVFADGFAGVEKIAAPDDAKHRPCGLAQGPDGSLYISDDVNGTIYRVIYEGGA